MKIFTVYDAKAETYLQPFFSQNEATAQRAFQAAATDEDHDFSKFAEDYTLFEIGAWNDEGGEIKTLEAKKPLANAIQYREAPSLTHLRAGEAK